MGKVILDADLRAKLQGGQTGVEVCDDTGQTIGYYLPRDEYVRLLYEIELAQPPISSQEREEARRELRETGGVTTAEVLDRLRVLGDQLRGGR
ncbi:MAG TPA: hypothetical protein VFG68_16000 [Fimbriiglobus sp.]|nr:hypothetical protein [Fimbriiglobus sp.]